MRTPNATFFTFDTSAAADAAIGTLGRSGFDMRQLSRTGREGPVTPAGAGTPDGALGVGGLSALGAALAHAGVPEDQVMRYEGTPRADNWLLVVQGSPEVQERARLTLSRASVAVGVHAGSSSHGADTGPRCR